MHRKLYTANCVVRLASRKEKFLFLNFILVAQLSLLAQLENG
jgi:hypothetical protein